MKKNFNAQKNYQKTLKAVGYVPRKQATQSTYDRVGFMSGLEVHQQLKTKHKLFCHCPAGIYNNNDDFDAEIIRHMRPTLSELGEYDGTALMEFKTRKKIIYRINNENACTYEIDDTPPFLMNKEALEKALIISLASKLNIVGEVHITRKQYLDGSIPTGFQRTAILGVEGEIYLKHKKVRLIQLSIEEDSCREISDIGHTRIYKTDRLGMPLIETVTYPDMVNPDEVKEACDYIRFLNRSTNLVRTGIGAGRQDVNVSCAGGTRVEIKGVAHTKWIPELTHNEVFRQWALLMVRNELKKRVKEVTKWKISSKKLNPESLSLSNDFVSFLKKNKYHLMAVNLPEFGELLSHFTQPGKVFADEISDRLKVIACLERPNMYHSEQIDDHKLKPQTWKTVREQLGSGNNDGQILFWAVNEDIPTALETIEERCKMAFDGVPQETRKSFKDGTTVFERVLPGADRMYPDTDSAPIPLDDKYIESLAKKIPTEVIDRYKQMKQWQIPEDTYSYIFSKNLFPLIKDISEQLKISPKFIGTFLGHRMKFVEGHFIPNSDFDYHKIYDMFVFIIEKKLDIAIAHRMISVVYEHPLMDFESVLTIINFKKRTIAEILAPVEFLREKYKEIGLKQTKEAEELWIMGQLHTQALGNMTLSKLKKEISKN